MKFNESAVGEGRRRPEGLRGITPGGGLIPETMGRVLGACGGNNVNWKIKGRIIAYLTIRIGYPVKNSSPEISYPNPTRNFTSECQLIINRFFY